MGYLDSALFYFAPPGEYGRFHEHQNTCDTLNLHNNNCHTHRYRYPISGKNAKKGKSHRIEVAFFNNKSSKNTCYGEAKIPFIMSTD